jgi:hypothetical protein
MRYKLNELNTGKFSNYTDQILINHGIRNPYTYTHLDDTYLYPYDLLPNIDKSTHILYTSLEKGGRIGILVDSDP